MSVADRIEARLRESFAPGVLRVEDESYLHKGHAGHRPEGETHFRVEIVAAAFAGKNRVERQRMVYAALGPLMGNPIHALAMTAKAPGE